MKRHNIIPIILVITLLSVIAFGCSRPVPADVTEVTEEVAPVDIVDVEGLDVKPMDQSLTVEDIVWQVISVEDLGTSVTTDTGSIIDAVRGKFISLEFMVENKGEDTAIIYDLKVIDDKGRVFSICLPAYEYFTSVQACPLVEVVPEVDYEFLAPFDVAPDSEGLILEVTNLDNQDRQAAYIDLGI